MTRYFILLLGTGLLLFPRPSQAQMSIAGPATPTTHALAAWFRQHVPAKFQARSRFEVQPLSDMAMDDYLHADLDADPAGGTQNDTDTADEIDGVFVNKPPQIVLRVSSTCPIDYATFAHEYGHFVWFDLLSKEDRKQYKLIYERQKSAHRLITEYAAESLEEGFAEAFSAYAADPATLLHQDPLSYQFLSRWSKE